MNHPDGTTDAIERSIRLDTPRARVWQALVDAGEFGDWFGADLQGQGRFAPGQRVRGAITYKCYEHLSLEMVVEQVVPETLLSFRWHPYAIDPAVDYSQEQATLVTFTLGDAPGGGTLLTVRESGFDAVPAARRAEAFRMNSGGWEAQMVNIERHVRATAAG